MLFWKTLTEKLVSLGFKVNPYDECVVNKIIHGQQCTILWHVDDIKISQADEQVVSDLVSELEKEYWLWSIAFGKYHFVIKKAFIIVVFKVIVIIIAIFILVDLS